MAIDTVPPLIAAQINYLVNHCSFSVKVEQMWSGCKNPNLLDRFTLVIPYCLDHIKWDVVFNAMYPLATPDVIFAPEDEGFQLFAGGSGKSSKTGLANWNSRDPSQLHSLIVELRNAYMVYQRKRIGELDDERVKFEISTMLSREGIEMYMSLGNDKPEEVKFAVPLVDMDLNRFVAGSTWRHPQKINLQVIFPVAKKYATVPPPRLKLISSPELKALFSTEDFKLPAWIDGMCTAEYLPNLEQMVNSQIKDAVSSIETRRKFIHSLVPHLGRPVEADPVFCRKATFLCSSGVFTFLVHFTLSLQFPKQQPALTFHSSQHFNPHGAPVKSPNLAEYPWSPRWSPSEKAERIFEFLAEEALNFKKYCNQLNQQ